MTRDQAVDLATSGMLNATPAGGGPSLAGMTPVGLLSWMSQGLTAWAELDLASGTYVLICNVLDPDTGMTHAMEGMVDILTVA